MAKAFPDQNRDIRFGQLMRLIYWSGIGPILGIIYGLVLKVIFGKDEDLDITKNFRKHRVPVRWPALIISVLIFAILGFLLFKLLQELVPGYNTKMEPWLDSIAGAISVVFRQMNYYSL